MQTVQTIQASPVPEPTRPLHGKTALVTGAGRGIGKAIALRLASQGANVAVNYRASRADAERCADRAARFGVTAHAIRADMTDAESLDTLRDEVRTRFGAIDILVNNAGINADSRFQNMTRDAWVRVVDTNLNAVFNSTKLFIDDLTRRPGGRVINVASFVGQKGNFGQTNYAASKGGIIAFTRALAIELARSTCTVNAVAPGFIATDMLLGVPERVRDKLVADIPLNRFGAPDEVAHAVAFLAHPESAYMTGEVLNVNGGLYMA